MLDFEHVSYIGITVALILTGMGLPVPEEVFVIIAGVAAKQGELEIVPALAACLAGAILGDCAMYAIGYHFGHGLFRDHPWFARFLKEEREQRVEQMIQRHGLKVFLGARFLVGLRSPVYVAAGILRIGFRRFLVVDTICATTVVGTVFGLSYLFSDQIYGLWGLIRRAEMALTITVIAAVLGVIGYFYLCRRRKAQQAATRREAAVDEKKSVA